MNTRAVEGLAALLETLLEPSDGYSHAIVRNTAECVVAARVLTQANRGES